MMNELWNENMNKHECKESHVMNKLWNKNIIKKLKKCNKEIKNVTKKLNV